MNPQIMDQTRFTTAPSNPNDWVMKQGPESSQPTHYMLRALDNANKYTYLLPQSAQVWRTKRAYIYMSEDYIDICWKNDASKVQD